MSQLWDCTSCGCRGISGGLDRCPVCQKETDMGKINALTGPTVFDPSAVQDEQVPEVQEQPVADEVQADTVPETDPVEPVQEPDEDDTELSSSKSR